MSGFPCAPIPTRNASAFHCGLGAEASRRRALLEEIEADEVRPSSRCPTVSFTHERLRLHALAQALAARQVHCWHGNSYTLALTKAPGLAPDGVLRLGLLHYNAPAEVDYFLAQLRDLVAASIA